MKQIVLGVFGLMLINSAMAMTEQEAEVKMRLVDELQKCATFNEHVQNHQESERLKDLIFINIGQLAPYMKERFVGQMELNNKEANSSQLSSVILEQRQEMHNTSFWKGFMLGSLMSREKEAYELLYQDIPKVSSEDMAKRLIIKNNCDLLGR